MTCTTNAPTLLVMAGGTGGHIFPGLAVADELKEQGWRIHWLGTADRMEANLVPKHGYNISFISISGLRHKGLLALLKLPIKFLAALLQARAVFKQVKPDVVLGMGGYASGPGGIVAWLMKKPLVLHEQNAAAGLTNRLLAKIASVVCCAFPNAFSSEIAHKVQIEVVGNPLRNSIGKQQEGQKIHNEIANKKILVVGGSLGAQVLNEIIPEAFNELAANDSRYTVWHQTGKSKQKEVLSAYKQADIASKKVTVTEFITDMAAAYEWADIVICRAGALTVSELAMAAKPAIFVPLPHAVDDHQTKNAQYLVTKGGAKLLPQKQLSKARLKELLTELFADRQTLIEMANATFAAAEKDATKKVANFCQQLVGPK